MKGPAPRARGAGGARVALAGALLCAASARADSSAGAANVGAPAVPKGDDCTITIVPERLSLTLGIDGDTRVDVTVTGANAGEARPGRMQVTVGTLDPLVPGTTLGTFTTTYHVPIDHFPQAALLMVEMFLPSGARPHATALIALPATTTFPFRTEPRASVTIEVAGHSYGPFTADAMGAVAIPIVVPPGVETGHAIASGRFGGVKDMEVNLQSRDYARVLLLAPPDADAGASVNVEAWAVEPSGEGAVPEDIDLRTSVGTVRRTGGTPGVARFAVLVPRDAASGTAQLTASMNDGSSERSEVMELHPGGAAVLVITSSLPQLVVGSGEIAQIEISARDRWDNDASVAGVAVTVDEQPLAIEGDADSVTAKLTAPAVWPGHEKATIAARLGNAEARKEILITGAEPAAVWVSASTTRLAADGRNAVDLVAEVRDKQGTPTTTSRIIWRTTDDGTLVATPSPRFGAYGARFVPHPALHDRRTEIDTIVDPDLMTSLHVDLETAPTRSATARVGLISNLGSLFGQSAFLEGTIPYPRRSGPGRLFSFGLSAGYLHGELSTPPNKTIPSLQTELNQFPMMGLVRMHIPSRWPVELSAVGSIGVTWVSASIADFTSGTIFSQGSAPGFVLGLGGDLAFPLRPGEFVVGVRYLEVAVERLSNGDRLSGNVGGLMGDLGFRLRL